MWGQEQQRGPDQGSVDDVYPTRSSGLLVMTLTPAVARPPAWVFCSWYLWGAQWTCPATESLGAKVTPQPCLLWDRRSEGHQS